MCTAAGAAALGQAAGLAGHTGTFLFSEYVSAAGADALGQAAGLAVHTGLEKVYSRIVGGNQLDMCCCWRSCSRASC